MIYLTIGQLAKATNISKVAIRYYERFGLLPTTVRRASGYRQYPESVVEQIRFIKNAKTVGFSLEEIKELLTLRQNVHASSQAVRDRTLAKWKDSHEKLLILQNIVHLLEYMLLKCDGKVSMKECPILKALSGEEGYLSPLLKAEK